MKNYKISMAILHSLLSILKLIMAATEYPDIARIFSDFAQLKVLIIGDVMVDAYVWGKADRISPEAPVPVLSVNRRENRLGGAANVALNIQALGATPLLCGVVGNDAGGATFKVCSPQTLFGPKVSLLTTWKS